MPKVSIIFPFYNCQQYIENSLLSIGHLPKEYEIIAVNDGSTDDSLNIAHKTLESLRIEATLLSSPINEGCFKARTAAIEASRGDYIAIADADDINYPRRFERQYDFLKHNDHFWCCGGWADKIDQNGAKIGTMDYPVYDSEETVQMILSDPTCNPIIDPSTMFRKSDFYELGGYSFEKDRDLVADMDLWFKSLLCGKKISNILTEIIKYRINPNSNTRLYQKEMIRQHVIVRNEFVKGIKAKNIE